MKFSSDNSGKKFYFNPKKEEEGSVTLRLVPKDILDDIMSKTTWTTKRIRRGQMQEEKHEDLPKQERLIWDYTIVDWENVSIDGEEIECNTENKYFMMMRVPKFSNFVADQVEMMRNEEMNDTELVGNSLTQSGNSTKGSRQDSTATLVKQSTAKPEKKQDAVIASPN